MFSRVLLFREVKHGVKALKSDKDSRVSELRPPGNPSSHRLVGKASGVFMCHFFSFCSDGKGNYLYADWTIRQKILSGKLLNYEPDSHTSIAHLYGFNGAKEDLLNKYEFNPLTKAFQNQINTFDDGKDAEIWVRNLDFQKVCPLLIIKPIVNPLNLPPRKPIKKDIENLKAWARVWVRVRDNVGAGVWASVWASVRDSVGDNIRASVRASVQTSLRDIAWASVWDSVGASVRASIWASIRAYSLSFFNIKYQYDFSPMLALYKRGFVPSYNGERWRLHNGKEGKIVYEGKF